jgi:hypothetical protein
VFFGRRRQHERATVAAAHASAGSTGDHRHLAAKVLSLEDELRAVRDEMRRLVGEQPATREPVERFKEDA